MSTPCLLVRADGGATATVHSLLRVEAYRATVGPQRLLLAALVNLLCTSPGTRTPKYALKALFALYLPNRATLVELGIAQPLFAFVMTNDRSGIVEDARGPPISPRGAASRG